VGNTVYVSFNPRWSKLVVDPTYDRTLYQRPPHNNGSARQWYGGFFIDHLSFEHYWHKTEKRKTKEEEKNWFRIRDSFG
jgi:hypothetical protein